MSSHALAREPDPSFAGAAGEPPRKPRGRRARAKSSLLALGEPMVWLTGGGLALAILMILGLLLLIVVEGFSTFWPRPLVQIRTVGGQVFLGEVSRVERYQPDSLAIARLTPELAGVARDAIERDGGTLGRQLLRTGNFELTQSHFRWIDDITVAEQTYPPWGLVVERLTWGRFYGVPIAFEIDGQRVADTAAASWDAYRKHHREARQRYARRRRLEVHEIGRINARLESARLALRQAELDAGRDSEHWRRVRAAQQEVERETAQESEAIRAEIDKLDRENERCQLVLATADGVAQRLPLASIVRAIPA
ncbi:MAG: hypothetical protein JNG90_06685, partial [Planctomycetaceae bacterium]|nr:hypothetical protein [Planctomycetaceae bacterium]